MGGPYPQLARAYIEYRHDRDVAREQRGEIHYHDLDYSPFFTMFNCMLID